IIASIAAIGVVLSIRQLRKRQWDYCQEAPAIIEWSDVCEDERPTRDKSRPYIAAIRYTYSVNGSTYSGLCGKPFSTVGEALIFLQRNYDHPSAVARYKREHPDESLVFPHKRNF